MENKIYITEDEFIALKLAMRNLQDDLDFSVKAHPDIIKNIIYPHGQKQIQDVFPSLIESRTNKRKRLKHLRKRWKRIVRKLLST